MKILLLASMPSSKILRQYDLGTIHFVGRIGDSAFYNPYVKLQINPSILVNFRFAFSPRNATPSQSSFET